MASRKPLVLDATGRQQQLQSGDSLGGLAAASLPGEAVRYEQNRRGIVVAFDGLGSVPTAGTLIRITCPYGGTIRKVTCSAADGTAGSFTVDIWKTAFSTSGWPTVANTIVASAKPTLAAAIASTDATLTGWTTTVAANDMLVFSLDTISTTTLAQIVLEIDPT
jgi:hypothetical protein